MILSPMSKKAFTDTNMDAREAAKALKRLIKPVKP